LGCPGWAYDDVLPYFKRAEGNERGGDEFHGSNGPLNVMDQRWPNPGSKRLC
jgi:choline dehydrogenase-like flavoprotein